MQSGAGPLMIVYQYSSVITVDSWYF